MPVWILGIFSNPLTRKIAAGLVVVGAIFLAGYKKAMDRTKAKTAKAKDETNERINDADVGKGDADADREWLRNRGKS